jgi:D-threo-aldose 1-dehydrogenase
VAQQFNKRRVGRTSLEVTELGLGGATLASIFQKVPDEQARATVRAGMDAGIGYFDTAPQYGFGRSEHLMGDALRFNQQGRVISTKVGRRLRPLQDGEKRAYDHAWVDPFPFDMVYDYSYAGVMRSFEDSLQRLGLPKVDILYVHDIGPMTHGVEQNKVYWKQLSEGGYKALLELKASGKISAIGLGVNEWEVLMEAFKLGDWDIFLLAGRYTLLEQTSLSPFLTTCVERGASIVAGAPFNGGALMGTGNWNYGKAPESIIKRVADLEAFCKEMGVPIGAAALQFSLAHPAVANVLVGPKSPAEVDGILAWWDTKIPDGFWDALADKQLVAKGTPLPNGRMA